MAILNAVFAPLLSRSHPIKLGTIVLAGNQLKFAMPSGDSYSYRGQLILQFVPVGGTITAQTYNVQASLDGGVTYNTVPTTPAQPIDGNAAPLFRVDMSGLGAINCQLNNATFTLGTGTGVDVWATCG